VSQIFDLLSKTEGEQEAAPRSINFHRRRALTDGALRVDEEMYKLVHRVFIGNGSAPPKLIVFTGVESGCGCTWVCARAGEALASAVEVPVCMVDADQLSPGLHRYFGIDDSAELKNDTVTSGSLRKQLTEIRGKNMWLMSCGDPQPNRHNGMLGLEKYKARLSELCSEFDYVLVDAPALSRSAQALRLGKMADGVILVVAANSTRRESARRAKESLQSAGVNVLGAVLNRRTYPIPEALYKHL
jgi:Mrp family chromosome partitioning ATPase